MPSGKLDGIFCNIAEVFVFYPNNYIKVKKMKNTCMTFL